MKKFTKLTKPQVRTVRRMFKQGRTRANIASDLNCTYAQVMYAINKAPLRGVTAKIEGKPSTNINWKEKYMEAALILLENGLVDITTK